MLAFTYNPGVPGASKWQQMQTSSQWRNMYNKGRQFENLFFIYEPKCKKDMYIFGLFGGPWGSMISLGLTCFPAILSPHIYVHVK